MRCKIFFNVRNAVRIMPPRASCISDHPKNPANKQEGFFDQKKSQSHVEMIVSFVLFVGFVVFLLLVFNPQKYTSLRYGSIDGVQIILMKNLTVEYNYTSVILTPASFALPSGQCFKIAPIAGISGELAVKDMDGAVTYSRNESDGKIVIEATDSQRFYEIYSSNFFSELPEECPNPITLEKSKNYSLGILATKSAVLYENIEELNRSYHLDYSGLKGSLGIKNDFSFIIRNETSVLFDTSLEQPQNINILSREIPFLSINKIGNTENLFINLGVW